MEIIKIVGISFLSSGIITFFIKQFIENKFDKKLEEFKNKLEYEMHKNKIFFEKESQTFETIWDLYNDHYESIYSMLFLNANEYKSSVFQCRNKLENYIEKKEPFISDNLFSALNEHLNVSRIEIITKENFQYVIKKRQQIIKIIKTRNNNG